MTLLVLRPKAVTVEAFCFDTDLRLPPWLSRAIQRGDAWYQGGEAPYLTVKTPKGEERVNRGDWVVLDHRGIVVTYKTPDLFRNFEYVG